MTERVGVLVLQEVEANLMLRWDPVLRDLVARDAGAVLSPRLDAYSASSARPSNSSRRSACAGKLAPPALMVTGFALGCADTAVWERFAEKAYCPSERERRGFPTLGFELPDGEAALQLRSGRSLRSERSCVTPAASSTFTTPGRPY